MEELTKIIVRVWRGDGERDLFEHIEEGQTITMDMQKKSTIIIVVFFFFAWKN